MSKIEITAKSEGRESVLTCDGYIIVSWAKELDGSKVHPPRLSASVPTELVGPELTYAVGVLAASMQNDKNPRVRLMGELIRATLEKGFAQLEAVSLPEIES